MQKINNVKNKDISFFVQTVKIHRMERKHDNHAQLKQRKKKKNEK